MNASVPNSERPIHGRLVENDRLLKETGHLFGLRELRRKQENPGSYEAIWQILQNICNTGWTVGCKVSSSPIATEGGDALWALHLPTGEAVCTSRGITAHPGLLALFVRSLIELGHSFGRQVVAEGIEDLATWRLLCDLDCDLGQGFLISPALPEAAAVEWMLGAPCKRPPEI